MEEFPYYGLSWFLYLIITGCFLLLTSLKTRKWSKWIRIPLLSFIAAMALTPGTTIQDQSWRSPAAIIMVFEMDQKGLSGIWPSLISIIFSWIFLIIATFIVRWLLINKLNISLKFPEIIINKKDNLSD